MTNKRNFKKRKALEFIENNSSKKDFIHWLINNTHEEVFSEDDDWDVIRRKVDQNEGISYSLLRSYAITLREEKITEEAMDELLEEAKEAEEVARHLTFLGRFKKSSIAVGGALFFVGLVKMALIIGFVFFEFPQFSFALGPKLSLELVGLLALEGLLEFVGGLFLISM